MTKLLVSGPGRTETIPARHALGLVRRSGQLKRKNLRRNEPALGAGLPEISYRYSDDTSKRLRSRTA